MAMQHRSDEQHDLWTRSLFSRLVADTGAATLSATLVAPAVTIIDRALVEKSLLNQSLLHGLRNHAVAALKNPARFTFQLPFGLIWVLYAATFTVANTTDTIGHAMKAPATSMITFLSTTAVNVPLGVWKDMRFAQIFGTQRAPVAAGAVDVARPVLVQNRAVARAATAIFLLRDSVTIFGSFTLAPRLSAAIPDSLATHPHAKPVITQLSVPALTQLVATPVHLLGLDLYMRQQAVPFVDRVKHSQRYLASSTVTRCIRIIPAFGFGCLANMEFREMFHEKVGEK
ncbi:hypothetical protein N7532_002806 [Penicillium argentinense]|uniref:Uncharacterized protein n=1 Tax=Penicillium argentinense TaxID=1131581 RepID=A0A9W9KLJ8_9EURO|nr:uncharacterized protein N7532_002806 [Penicillium argentinense]KAJ5110161.1 hypothetical protein N7532_002806 [Penicillium argentinense]